MGNLSEAEQTIVDKLNKPVRPQWLNDGPSTADLNPVQYRDPDKQSGQDEADQDKADEKPEGGADETKDEGKQESKPESGTTGAATTPAPATKRVAATPKPAAS